MNIAHNVFISLHVDFAHSKIFLTSASFFVCVCIHWVIFLRSLNYITMCCNAEMQRTYTKPTDTPHANFTIKKRNTNFICRECWHFSFSVMTMYFSIDLRILSSDFGFTYDFFSLLPPSLAGIIFQLEMIPCYTVITVYTHEVCWQYKHLRSNYHIKYSIRERAHVFQVCFSPVRLSHFGFRAHRASSFVINIFLKMKNRLP